MRVTEQQIKKHFRILVIGGSYFLGKAFVKLAIMSGHEVTVFNRGNKPLNMNQVKEIYGNRRNIEALKNVVIHQSKEQIDRQEGHQADSLKYDAIVDFCGYEIDDIAVLFQCLSKQFRQYIYISTCDVYKHGTGKIQKEDADFEERQFDGEVGQYISGKVSLEKELQECAKQYQIPYTSIRPAFIYGPENYAPREDLYFHWIEQAGQILHPVDATGEFQMVYVGDVAKAIMNAVGNEKAYNECFNLTPTPMISYDIFAEALEKTVNIPFERIPVTVDVVCERQIPLPFPLTKDESNWYDGQKALQLIEHYTTLEEGMKLTYKEHRSGN